MLQQVQQMQSGMQQAQAELSSKEVTASVAGGRVEVKASGTGDITAIKIAPEIVDPTDVDMLQDLVLSAVKQAQAQVKEMAAAEMGKVTGGLKLPPGMGF